MRFRLVASRYWRGGTAQVVAGGQLMLAIQDMLTEPPISIVGKRPVETQLRFVDRRLSLGEVHALVPSSPVSVDNPGQESGKQIGA